MYDWIESTFNVSGGVTQVIAVVIALTVVLLLFSLFVFVLRRLMGSKAPQGRSRQPRLAVMDNAPVDARRSLILIRRDNVEHLLLIGGPSDVVVEQNIVRNAPVPASRVATNATGPQTAPGAMKVPTAPGPDIPARPDSTVQQPGPAPSNGAAALRATRQPSAGTQPRAPARPDSAEHLAQRARPVNGTGKSVAPAGSGVARTAPEKPSGSVAGSSAAADLLRAATQNGFNRSTSTAPKVSAEAPVAVPPEDVSRAVPVKAPEVQPAPVVSLELETGKDDLSESPLRSLGRSIANRERSAKPGHTITPPASGPAARAKTALLRPVETVDAPENIEPPMEETAVKSADNIASNGDHPENSQDKRVEPEVMATAIGSEPMLVDKELDRKFAFEDDIKLEQAEDDMPAIASVEPEPDTSSEAVDAATETPSPAPREVKIDLDLGDLLDDAEPEQLEVTSAPATNGNSNPQAQPQSESQDQENPDQPTQSRATLDIVPGAPRAIPENRVVQGLGDKNPIEDEMAKILYELGGQPNR